MHTCIIISTPKQALTDNPHTMWKDPKQSIEPRKMTPQGDVVSAVILLIYPAAFSPLCRLSLISLCSPADRVMRNVHYNHLYSNTLKQHEKTSLSKQLVCMWSEHVTRSDNVRGKSLWDHEIAAENITRGHFYQYTVFDFFTLLGWYDLRGWLGVKQQ